MAAEFEEGLVAFPIQPFAQQLAMPTHGFCLLARAALGRLLIAAAELHFAEDSFALHLLFQRLQCLIDIVVAHDHLNDGSHSSANVNIARAGRATGCRL